MLEPDRPQMTIQYDACVLHVRWLRSHTHTHTHLEEYEILIAFPLQQWLRESASLLRYTYIACVVLFLYYIQTYIQLDHLD